MTFVSNQFLVFFTVIFLATFLIPKKYRPHFLLAVSYYFYGKDHLEYVFLLLFSSAVDFFCSRQISKCENESLRSRFLWLSIATNLSVLAFFKYSVFFSENLNSVFSFIAIDFKLTGFEVLLPVGLSFFTFQSMSYTFDIYQRRYEPEKNWIHFFLYVSFFPQLVAGPIERANTLIPQIRKGIHLNPENIVSGGQLLLWGLFKKVSIADNLSGLTDPIFSAPENYGGWHSLAAIYTYTLVIYFDFSGYTDMARGIARMFGIELSRNFVLPITSLSVKEFWKRWHITLTNWFTDYLFYPLIFSKSLRQKVSISIFLTFVISGFWHGANWTFIVWGALHGLFIIGSDPIDKYVFSPIQRYAGSDFTNTLRWLLTFNLVSIAWVFFRSDNMDKALSMFTAVTRSISDEPVFAHPISKGLFFIGLFFALVVYAASFIERYQNRSQQWQNISVNKMLALLLVLAWVTILTTPVDSGSFIYFRF